MRFKLLYIEGKPRVRCNIMHILEIYLKSHDTCRIYVNSVGRHPLKLVYCTLFRDFALRDELSILLLFTSLVLL